MATGSPGRPPLSTSPSAPGTVAPGPSGRSGPPRKDEALAAPTLGGGDVGILLVLVALGSAARYGPPLPYASHIAGGAALVWLLVRIIARGAVEKGAGLHLRPATVLAVALAAAWVASRPPWGDAVSGVIWAGALLTMVGVPRAWDLRTWSPRSFGVLILGAAGAFAAAALVDVAGDPSRLGLLVFLGAARAVAWVMLERHGALIAAVWLAGGTLPFAPGVWGLGAVGVELAVFLLAREAGRGLASGWPFVIGAGAAWFGIGFLG